MLVVESAVGQEMLARARALGLPLERLAGRVGMISESVDDLLRGRTSLDRRGAAQLSDALGETPDYWLALEADDDDDEADLVAAWRAALDDFQPATLSALRARGEVTATRAQPERLATELAAFFGCPPNEVDALVTASFRQSKAHAVHADAVSTWLRLADRQAAWVADLQGTPAFDAAGLSALLPNLVRVGTQSPTEYVPRVQAQLAEVGVVLVFQADVKGTRLSGASWPTEAGHGVVALTLRYRKDDFFWWTVFHECAHLLLEHGRVVDADGQGESEREAAADRLAHALLLPADWTNGMSRFSRDRLSGLGRELDVPVGLLVGQLQHVGRVSKQHMNRLKEAMPDPADLEVHRRRRPVGTAWEHSMAVLVERASRAS